MYPRKLYYLQEPFDLPKILSLSGIGPTEDLQKFCIEVICDLLGICKGFRDHSFASLTILQEPGTNDRQ